MMIILALLLSSVRPEPVEGRPAVERAGRPSTSSGRTETVPKGSRTKTPLDAERAFAADAQVLGQWAAFRKWAAADAVMFVPRPINAQVWLKDRADPAKAISWWPTAVWVSCDGSVAVDTGGWQRPDGKVGYFTTIWRRQADGSWKWLLDSGDTLERPRSPVANPELIRASCRRVDQFPPPVDVPCPPNPDCGGDTGHADDLSLIWRWELVAGGRSLEVSVAGIKRPVIEDYVAAPTP